MNYTSILGDVKDVVVGLMKYVQPSERKKWVETIDKWREEIYLNLICHHNLIHRLPSMYGKQEWNKYLSIPAILEKLWKK